MSENGPWGGQPDQPPPGEPGTGPTGYGAPLPRYPSAGSSQPPPGYGQPPYGQPGYGQPGYSQPPPYGQPPPHRGPGSGAPGYGQWAAPPAPAPGGVPLRPLAVGDILSGAFTLIRQNPAATLGIAAVVQTIYGIISAFISWAELKAADQFTASITPQSTSTQVVHALGQFVSSFAPYLLVDIVLIFIFQAILTGMLTGALGRGILGNKISIGEAWRIARVPAVIMVSILVLLILVVLWIPVAAIVIVLAMAKITAAAILIGAIGFVGTFIATVWISIRLTLAVPAIVLEGAGPFTAMKRSWQLVQGSWWRVFGISLLAGIVLALIGLILQIPFTIVGSLVGGSNSLSPIFSHGTTTVATAAGPSVLAIVIGAIGSIIAATCTRPVSAGVTVLLYTDLRMRKEGLDLALHQAGQQRALTGDEFMSLWRPGLQGPGQFPGTGPGQGGGWTPGGGPGGVAGPSRYNPPG